jgi:hypothetical protein
MDLKWYGRLGFQNVAMITLQNYSEDSFVNRFLLRRSRRIIIVKGTYFVTLSLVPSASNALGITLSCP